MKSEEMCLSWSNLGTFASIQGCDARQLATLDIGEMLDMFLPWSMWWNKSMEKCTVQFACDVMAR